MPAVGTHDYNRQENKPKKDIPAGIAGQRSKIALRGNALMMDTRNMSTNAHSNEPEKAPTVIEGLDEITGGRLPKRRSTLICGSAGCGKTLMAMQILAQDNQSFGEPGVFMAFEETADDLAKNFASLGYNLGELATQKKILIDYIHIDISGIEETGEYGLEGLSIRLGSAIDDVGTKRLVLVIIEALVSRFKDEGAMLFPIRRSTRA